MLSDSTVKIGYCCMENMTRIIKNTKLHQQGKVKINLLAERKINYQWMEIA